jgi:Flp pilus assembly pilin Flp
MYSSNSSPKNDDRERGATMVEYVLLVSLLAFASLVGMSTREDAVESAFITAGNASGQDGSPTAFIVPANHGKNGKNVDAGQAGQVRFVKAGGQVRFGDLKPSKGWTLEITKDNGRRATAVLTKTESGEHIIINAWINDKGQLETSQG